MMLDARDCLRINVANLPNCHRAVARSTMVVTKPKGDNSKAEKKKKRKKKKMKKPVKKKPAKKKTVGEMPTKKTKGSTASHDDKAYNNETNELFHMLLSELVICGSFLKVPPEPYNTAENIRKYDSVIEETTTRAGVAAHSCYLRLLQERGHANNNNNNNNNNNPIHIPESDTFIGILELVLATSSHSNLARLAENVRGLYRWEKAGGRKADWQPRP